jgi:hypothetical protein
MVEFEQVGDIMVSLDVTTEDIPPLSSLMGIFVYRDYVYRDQF